VDGFAITFLSVAAYGALHSLLLTGPVRRAAAAVLGEAAYRGVFRLAYNVLATALLAVLLGGIAALPDRELVRMGGVAAAGLWAVRLAGLAVIAHCVRRVGFGRFLGWEHFRAWRRGETVPGPDMEAGELVVEGPYRYVRHPMYTAGAVVLWAQPTWTWNGLAFALAATLYLWLGSLHEERRMLETYGDTYRRYRDRTPAFVPTIPRSGEG